MITKLAEIIKAEDGLEAYVVEGTKSRFNAVLRDTDAGETITAKYLPTLEAAIETMNGFFAEKPVGSLRLA